MLTLPPAPALSAWVQGYWFIQDLAGMHAGRPIHTSPIPLAVLSVNMGRPNAAEDGSLVPHVSLLGLQSRARAWRSWSDTYFVMVMLTVPGIIRLFPHAGEDSADRLLDLGAMIGDARAGALSAGMDPAAGPRAIAAQLDRWLIGRLMASVAVPEAQRLVAAHHVLRLGGRVEQAAQAAQTDRRQLQRWCHRHLGVGPKDLADLERLHRSLRNLQTGRGDAVEGYSDQAHQIRSWRRRLGVTPGAYARQARSALAAQFSEEGREQAPRFYL
ncbi:helix-turn-helix domain-containing protein [Achromobacter pestifer]